MPGATTIKEKPNGYVIEAPLSAGRRLSVLVRSERAVGPLRWRGLECRSRLLVTLVNEQGVTRKTFER